MAVNQAGLATVRATLEADGYGLDVEERDGRVGVRVVATPSACEDCLVPKPLMRAMIGDALGVPEQAIDLTYPGEAP